MKKHFGIIVLPFLLFAYAHAAQNPFQRAELMLHPITGDMVRVFDILVRIDSADVDGLADVFDAPEQYRERISKSCNAVFKTMSNAGASWHPTGICYQMYIEEVFRRLADLMYEATNGKHLLGKVYFTKDANAEVDVEWLGDEQSCGYTLPGAKGAVGDASLNEWQKPGSKSGIRLPHRNPSAACRLTWSKELAATLMHEWGHYALDLGDEYSHEDTCTLEHPEKYKSLLVNPNAPISCPIINSEWKLDVSKYGASTASLVQSVVDSIGIANYEVSTAYTLAPQLMTFAYVLHHGDGGSMRYANLSTDWSYCEEGHLASYAGKCTPKTFRATRGGHTVNKKYRRANGGPEGQGYSAWTYITRPLWASNLDNLGPYRWPELATVAPRYDDVDAKGNRFVKIDSTSEEIMRHYLHLDWSLWDTTMSYDRSVMFLVDLSNSMRDSASIRNLKRTIAAALLLAEDQPNLNIGFQAAAYLNSSWEYVPIQPAGEAIPKILEALNRMRFDGWFFDQGVEHYGFAPLADRPGSEKKHLVLFSGGRSGTGSFSMRSFRDKLDEAGVKFHVQYFLDSAKNLPEMYDFAARTRSFSGTVAYDFSERDDAGLYDELRLLASTMGFDAVKLVPRAANHAYGETRSLKFHDGMAPLKSIGETCGFLHFKETPYGAKDSVCVETKSTSLQDLKPYQLCEVEPETWHEVAARDKSYRNATKMSPSGEQGTAFGTVEEQIVTKENPVGRFYSQSGAANLLPGEALLLTFEVGDGELLAGLHPKAEICDVGRPGEQCTTMALRDDGMHGDQSANDGRYTLYWDGYASNGPFRVEVVADSMGADAKWLSIEGENSRKADSNEFVRESAIFQFAVLGDLSDDVPDTIGAGRTLDSGIVVEGRLNGGSDVDCYGWGAHPDTGMVLRVMNLNGSSAIRVAFLSDSGDTVLVRTRDLERETNRMTIGLPRNHGAGVCIDATDGSTANYKLLLDGRQPWDETPKADLRVLAKDHHFGHPQISVLSFKVENIGDVPLIGGELHYFFTMPEGTPYLLDYYTPDCDPEIVDHGEGRYELRMRLNGELAAGATTPEGQENQLHLRGTNYETLNVSDDWSHPQSVTFVETDSIAVTDQNDEFVYGSAPEWWRAGGVK